MDYSVKGQAIEELSERMAAQMKRVATELGHYVGEEQRTIGEMEKEVLQAVKGMGQALLAGLCALYVPAYPEGRMACGCGGEAVYQRKRSGESKTILGRIEVKRPYYLCGQCHHGAAPLDEVLGLCAGGMSTGLSELMALLGVQFPFEEAAAMLARLTLVEVSANACRKATESLGSLVAAAEQAEAATAWATQQPQLPALHEAIAGHLYVSMDGVTVHIEGEGWKNQYLGAVYTSKATVSKQRPDKLEIRTEQPSFYTDLSDVETFGRHLWLEAQRRGLAQAQQVIVIGDGAHWIWHLADEHFPGAIQILDWYHAASYLWRVADALYGESTDLAKHWAKQHLDLLWQGDVQAVCDRLQAQAAHKPAGQDALTYFRNNQHRMRYDRYRALGLQIGSGTIESGCKHLIAARLKQAGMIWSRLGARFVAKLRARLKSRRWDETLALRPPPARSYARCAV